MWLLLIQRLQQAGKLTSLFWGPKKRYGLWKKCANPTSPYPWLINYRQSCVTLDLTTLQSVQILQFCRAIAASPLLQASPSNL